MLLSEDGHLYSKGKKDGGIYLILWPPEKDIASKRERLKQQERRRWPVRKRAHIAVDDAVGSDKIREITSETSLALWERLESEIRRQRKRAWDMMAGDADDDEVGEDTTHGDRQDQAISSVSSSQPITKVKPAEQKIKRRRAQEED